MALLNQNHLFHLSHINYQLLMKIKNVYKLFALALLFVTLQSRSTGPGSSDQELQVTGAPGSTGNTGTCGNAGCHSSGAFSPSASIQLLDGTEVVTVYQPGKTYSLKVAISAGTGSPARFGFQAVSLNDANSQSGSWGNVGSDKHPAELSGRSYVEHSFPSSNSAFEMEWKAPDAGSGDVTFYSAGIASNNNGGTSGDGMAKTSLVVGEDISNGVVDNNRIQAKLRVVPNPVQETLSLEINSQIAGMHQIRIIDVLGKVVGNVPINIQQGLQMTSIPVDHLPVGLYVVQLYGNRHLAATQMLKR